MATDPDRRVARRDLLKAAAGMTAVGALAAGIPAPHRGEDSALRIAAAAEGCGPASGAGAVAEIRRGIHEKPASSPSPGTRAGRPSAAIRGVWRPGSAPPSSSRTWTRAARATSC